jgi:hypothetical protein
MYPRATLQVRQSRPRTHLPQHLLGSLGGQQAWSWSMQMRWSSSNGVRHIAQTYPCVSSMRANRSGVRPMSLSLYARFQRDLASGVTSVFSRRSVSRALRSAKAAAVRHSPRWPGIRPQYSLARGIHLLHRSPVGWPLADMVFTHLRQSEPVGCANILRARLLSWAMLGSNQRPPRCQRGALPLRQSPSRRRRESNPRTGLCRPLPKPLGHSASANVPCRGIMALDIRRTVRAWGLRDGIRRLRADDGIRTRDPHLGKVMLYQLSHVRMPAVAGWCTPARAGVRSEL